MAPQPLIDNACKLTSIWFRLVPLRSPLLGESLLLSFPAVTEMFQFSAFAHDRLWIQRPVAGMNPLRLPDSEIPGSMPVSGSPGLFAAAHVLHRLPAPRHSPCALCSLTVSRRYTSHALCQLRGSLQEPLAFFAHSSLQIRRSYLPLLSLVSSLQFSMSYYE